MNKEIKEEIISWCKENSWTDSVPKNTFPNAKSEFQVVAVYELIEFLTKEPNKIEPPKLIEI